MKVAVSLGKRILVPLDTTEPTLWNHHLSTQAVAKLSLRPRCGGSRADSWDRDPPRRGPSSCEL